MTISKQTNLAPPSPEAEKLSSNELLFAGQRFWLQLCCLLKKMKLHYCGFNGFNQIRKHLTHELIENQADILIPTLIHESNAETDVDLHIGWSKLIVVAGELHNACELALQMISFVHFFFLDGNVLVKGFWQNSPSFQGSICQDGEITRVREALRLVFLL